MDRYVPTTAHGDAKTSGPSAVDTSLPKNFVKPLTCFFWHQNGRCNKRDADCAYAHWNTGYLATAPINVTSDSGMVAVAGRNARNLNASIAWPHDVHPVADNGQREQFLKNWELDLQLRERNIKEREDALERDTRTRRAEARLRERRLTRRERAMKRDTETMTRGGRRDSGSG